MASTIPTLLADAVEGGGLPPRPDASLAPYLDPPKGPSEAASAVNVDESWVLPAVGELGGRPEVADDGTIV